MMEQFRKLGNTKFSKVMLSLLALSFAAWGIGGYLMPTIGAAAVTVNGEGISASMVEQTMKQRIENIAQLLGTRPTQEQMDQMQLPEQIVTEVVARTVLRQEAEKLGFLPATQQLQDEIALVGAFKNEQGVFDVARYRQILNQIGRSPAQFEHDLGQDIIVRQLSRLAKMELADPKLALLVAKAEDAKLVLETATFDVASLGNGAEPTQSELEAFYKDNTQAYSKPETRDLTILRISREETAKSIDVPEADVRKAYEDNKAAYALPEQRMVRHILLDSREEAEKVAANIKTLADFEKAANEFSKDPGNQGRGGTLGTIQEKDVVPAFGKEAFTLAAGTLSKPVQSNFGWHLIWVDSIEPAKSLSFDEVKDAIAKDLQVAEADKAMERMVELADTRIAAGEDLSKVATEIGVKAIQHNMVTAADEGVEPQELQAGFNVQKGEVSVPITMKDGGSAYVQATDVMPAKVLPLSEVKDRVTTDFKNARNQMQLRQNADKLLAAARAPGASGDLSQLAAKAGVNGVKVQTITLNKPEETPMWLQQNLLELYPLAIGATLPAPLRDGQNWHVVRLTGRSAGVVEASSAPELAKIYQQRIQGDVEALLMSYLTQKAKVKMSQDHLKQLFGREVTWDITDSR